MNCMTRWLLMALLSSPFAVHAQRSAADPCDKPSPEFAGTTGWRPNFWKARCYLFYQVAQSKTLRDSSLAYQKGIRFLNAAYQEIRKKPESELGFEDEETFRGATIGLKQTFSTNAYLIEAYGAVFAPWGIEVTAALLQSEVFKSASFNIRLLPIYEQDSPDLFFDVRLPVSEVVPAFGQSSSGRASFAYLDTEERKFMMEAFKLGAKTDLHRAEFLRIYSPVWYQTSVGDLIHWSKKTFKIRNAVMTGVALYESGGTLAPIILANELYDLYEEFWGEKAQDDFSLSIAFRERTEDGARSAGLDVTNELMTKGIQDVGTDVVGKKVGEEVGKQMVEFAAEWLMAKTDLKMREAIRSSGEAKGYDMEEGRLPGNWLASYAPRPPIALMVQLSTTYQHPDRPCFIGACYDELAWGTKVFLLQTGDLHSDAAASSTLHDIIQSEDLKEVDWHKYRGTLRTAGDPWKYIEANGFREKSEEIKSLSAEPSVQEVAFMIPKRQLEAWATQMGVAKDKVPERIEAEVYLDKLMQNTAHTPLLRAQGSGSATLADLMEGSSGEQARFQFGVVSTQIPLGSAFGEELVAHPPNRRITHFRMDLRPHQTYYLLLRYRPSPGKPYEKLGVVKADFMGEADGFSRRTEKREDHRYLVDSVIGKMQLPEVPAQKDVTLERMDLAHKGRKMGLIRVSYNPHIAYHQSGVLHTPGFALVANEPHEAWATARYVQLRATGATLKPRSVSVELNVTYDRLSVMNEPKYEYRKTGTNTWVCENNTLRLVGYELRKLPDVSGNEGRYWRMNITQAPVVATSATPKFDLPPQTDQLHKPVSYLIALKATVSVPPGATLPQSIPLMVIEIGQ